MPTQYGQPNQVYQPGGMPVQSNQQQKQPKMFENWGGLQYLMGPGAWGMEYLKPGINSSIWGGLKNTLFGKDEQIQQIPQFDPQQMSALAQILQQALGGQGLGGNLNFGPIADRARSQFQEQTVPSIAERFASMGGLGTSMFTKSLGQAGAGLDRDLAAMEQQFNLQREPQLQNLLRLGLMPKNETMVRPGTQGLLGGLLGSAAPAAGQAGAMYGMSKLLPLLM